MRISDWSSDVCSSDLRPPCPAGAPHERRLAAVDRQPQRNRAFAQPLRRQHLAALALRSDHPPPRDDPPFARPALHPKGQEMRLVHIVEKPRKTAITTQRVPPPGFANCRHFPHHPPDPPPFA